MAKTLEAKINGKLFAENSVDAAPCSIQLGSPPRLFDQSSASSRLAASALGLEMRAAGLHPPL